MSRFIKLFLAAPLAMFVSPPSNAQAFKSDTRYVTCGIRYPNNQTAQYTSIAKMTKPALPVGSDRPVTLSIINGAWRSLLIEKGVKFHESYCLAGDSVDTVRAVVANYELRIGYSKMKREEIAFDNSWPKLINRVFEEDRVINRAVTRNQYAVEPAGSVGEGMGTALFDL